MHCPSCQHENREQAAFCEGCGARLERTCSSCGNALRAAARFCDACGLPFGAEAEPSAAPERDPREYTPKHLADKILTSKAALEGERKHVTVMFADVANYTALSERTDPEEIHTLMDRCFQLILEQVHHFEGTVNQFTGDGVMALFGAPLALEDAPRRAVLAALAIQKALRPLDREVQARHGREFRMRIGIHTGPVVVATIGDDLRMDYTAIGDTTNLAARLEQIAQPDAVLVSAATESLVSGFFDVRDLGEVGVKGKSAPVRAYEIVAERPVSGRIEAAGESGLTPLIGREREQGALRAAFESARSGSGQVAFIVGEAGIGKSRLTFEFRQSLADTPHTWFEGRCASYAQNTALLPIIDALRRGFGIDDRDDEAAALAKLEHGVLALNDGLAWALPFLRHLLSLPTGDDGVAEMAAAVRRSEVFRALQSFFVAAALQAPLVFVVEDLHWIDAASEELLGYLSDAIPAISALFIFTHRPGYRHPFGDRSYHVRAALQPLSRDETSRLTSALLDVPQLPEELSALIARKADGNPFFVEEVTKSLLEDGAVRLEDGRALLTRGLDRISVPDSIQDVLMARIDRLAEDPKNAIQIASVIGREFALRLLERIVEVGDQMQSVVDELRALELIYEKARHPELAFMFKHALTHDVAYQSLLIARRKALHQIVGSAIEELYQDRLSEYYETLAHHFTCAEDWERALDYHERAARKSANTFANQAAAEQCRLALEIAERLESPPERRRDLEELLARVLYDMSDVRAAAEAFMRCAELHEPGPMRAKMLALAGNVYLWCHDFERGEEVTHRALSEARESGSDAALAMGLAAHALHRSVTGSFDEQCLDMSAESSELAFRSGDTDAVIWATGFHCIGLKHTGAFREAIALSERTLATVSREHRTAPMPMWTLGLALGGIGEYGRALSIFQNGVEMCERIGESALKARLLNSLGWLYAEFGCHGRAAEYNQRCNELAAEIVKRELIPGAPELYANGKINLAGNQLNLGDTAAASGELEPIRDELATPGDPWMRWRYAMHLLNANARVALAQGDADGALALLDEELEAARRNRSLKIEARALELRGRVLTTFDARPAAEEALRAALEVAGAIEYPPVIWRSHSLLSELARRGGTNEERDRHAQSARALVVELAASLPAEDLKREFLALGQRLVEDPLGAYH